jgi:hypothetical protein
MKKIYSIVILITIGIMQIYAQNCYQCGNGTNAFMVGAYTTATDSNSFVGGNYSTVTSRNGFAFGYYSTVNGLNGIALGSYANVLQASGIAIGNYVQSNAANSYVFGMGTSSSALLTNDKPNSLMFGVTHKPSLTIAKPTGGGDIGYLGIGTTEPKEMAHVVGTLLIERTEETASRLQFKHPDNTAKGNDPHDTLVASPYYWDIYSDTQGLKFNTVLKSNGSSAQLMVLSRNGRLGIGIENPLAKLHVNQNMIAEGDITTFNKLVLAPDNNSTSERWEISRTNNGLNYTCQTGMLALDVLFVGSNGSIGIGKTNPSETLDVNGSFKANDATITGLLTAKTLNAQSATIDGALSADVLSANSATINDLLGDVNVGGLLSAPNVKITTLLCAKEILVKNNASCWPDYVFNKDYKLPSLNELEQFIAQNQHLPNVPSAAEVEANGVELGEMNALLLQKVEELTLYIIQMQKQIDKLKNERP